MEPANAGNDNTSVASKAAKVFMWTSPIAILRSFVSKGPRKVQDGDEHSYVGPRLDLRPGGGSTLLRRNDSARVKVMPLGVGSVMKHSREVLGHVRFTRRCK